MGPIKATNQTICSCVSQSRNYTLMVHNPTAEQAFSLPFRLGCLHQVTSHLTVPIQYLNELSQAIKRGNNSWYYFTMVKSSRTTGSSLPLEGYKQFYFHNTDYVMVPIPWIPYITQEEQRLYTRMQSNVIFIVWVNCHFLFT